MLTDDKSSFMVFFPHTQSEKKNRSILLSFLVTLISKREMLFKCVWYDTQHIRKTPAGDSFSFTVLVTHSHTDPLNPAHMTDKQTCMHGWPCPHFWRSCDIILTAGRSSANTQHSFVHKLNWSLRANLLPFNILKYLKDRFGPDMMSVSQLACCCTLTDKNSYFWFLTEVVSWRSAAKVLFASMLYHSFSICFRLIVLLRLIGQIWWSTLDRFRSFDLIRKERRNKTMKAIIWVVIRLLAAPLTMREWLHRLRTSARDFPSCYLLFWTLTSELLQIKTLTSPIQNLPPVFYKQRPLVGKV